MVGLESEGAVTELFIGCVPVIITANAPQHGDETQLYRKRATGRQAN